MAVEISFIDYKDVISKIENRENHLLIGNGFNYGLGINTGYGSIFKKMIENNRGIYSEAMSMIEGFGYDLEAFIGKLESDINEDNLFLKKYVRNKVKFDFMQATHEIVKSEVKNVYAKNNEGIFILLQNFTNYFSLNYDSLLYLLLLKHKLSDNDEKNSVVFLPSLKFIESDFDEKQNNIYTEIKAARENGMLTVSLGVNNVSMNKPFSQLTKTHFATEVKEYSKTNKKGWISTDIDRVVKKIFEEEQRNRILANVDDGFRPNKNLFDGTSEWVCDFDILTQNLFFLHVAFHIYNHKQCIKKITQESDKALYEKLQEIINNEEKDIICVFQHCDKEIAIKSNDYLLKCLNKLGDLVKIGSPIMYDKNHSEILFVSPVSGEVLAVERGEKRKLPNKTWNFVCFMALTPKLFLYQRMLKNQPIY